jgi:hypothetical protein
MTDTKVTPTEEITVIQQFESLVLKKSESQIVNQIVKTESGSKIEAFSIQTLTIDYDWSGDHPDLLFIWRGRSRFTGEPNKIIVNWTTYEISWFIADFTNQGDTYWLHPSFYYQYKAGDRVLTQACFDTVAIPDKNAGAASTIMDLGLESPRRFTSDADSIEIVYRRVTGTVVPNATTCLNYL